MNPFTLRSFWRELFAPTYLTAAAPKTFRAYEETLDHWSRIVGEAALNHITPQTLAAFKAGLAGGGRPKSPTRQLELFDLGRPDPDPLAAATVNKHLRNVAALLAKAGPPGPGNRDALALLDRVPWVKPLRELHRLPKLVRAADIVAAYQACETAKYPRLEGVRPGNWWKALYAAAYTSGFRRAALMGLVWDQLDLVAESVRVDAGDDKCGQERAKPLHHVVVLHLVRIRTVWQKVFAWPHSESTWYRQWHRIQENAGIPEVRRFGIHDLKRAAGSIYAASSKSPWVVQLMLDHASLATSSHYVNASDDLRPAVEAFPLPRVICADVGEDARPPLQLQVSR